MGTEARAARSAAGRRVALMYAAAAGTWIVASDLVVAFASGEFGAVVWASIAKGALFVAASSLLLYLAVTKALAGQAAWLDAAPAEERPRWWRSPASVVLLLGAALVAGLVALQWQHSRITLEAAHNAVAAVGELKARQIEQWIALQADVAATMRSDRSLLADVAALQRHSAPGAAQALRARLGEIRASLGARTLAVVNAEGQVLVAAGADAAVSPALRAELRHATATGVAHRVLLHRDPDGRQRLDYVVPLARAEAADFAVLLLRHDPRDFLLPLVESWPEPSLTAESLLVRLDGDEIAFMTGLRQPIEAAPGGRVPLWTSELVAARIIRDGARRLRGADYHGADVLAYGRPLRGTNWALVAKIDVAEVMADVRRTTLAAMALILGLTLLAGLGATLLWRQQAGIAELRRRALQVERDAIGEHLQMLSRYANDIILLLNDQGLILNANERADEAYGYPRGGIIGLRADRLRPAGDRGFDPAFQRVLEEGNLIYETVHVRKDGAELPVEISARRIDADGRRFVQAIIRDITERKRALAALRESHDLLNSVVENAPIRVFWKDLELRYLGCNSSFARDSGLSSPGELIGKDDFQMAWRDQAEIYRADDRKVIESDSPRLGIEEPQTTPDGRTIWLRTSKVPLHAVDGKVAGVLGIYEDITERKRAEVELRDSEERFRAMIEQSISGTCIIDKAGRFVYVNPRLAEILGYDSYKALVGRPVLEVVAPESHAVIRDNMRERLAGEPQRARYHFEAIRKDRSRITLGAHGTPGVYRGEKVLITTVQDVTEIKRAEDEVQRTVAKLERALHSTIEVVSTIGELRDPYTHGHEHRVGDIAAAIAVEMGLSADQVEGIRVAGYMHDVGKIAVPAEILVKPTRLTPAEYELVKGHAQQGYEILKRVEFPWPVAETAWQHHERLDGSGYPRGLKGEAIILEARVLAVADTVEAMASHRPYRPGMGIEKALAEIERSRGALYDPRAVDACLRLFREKGFQLPK